MSNTQQPLTSDEKQVIALYNLASIVIFSQVLSASTIEFLITIMRMCFVLQQHVQASRVTIKLQSTPLPAMEAELLHANLAAHYGQMLNRN